MLFISATISLQLIASSPGRVALGAAADQVYACAAPIVCVQPSTLIGAFGILANWLQANCGPPGMPTRSLLGGLPAQAGIATSRHETTTRLNLLAKKSATAQRNDSPTRQPCSDMCMIRKNGQLGGLP
jgi:hypothetical protein